jgi:acylphosphatase
VSEHRQAKRYIICGTVQGVGYRYFTQHAANRLHLGGNVRNLPDGRVEVYAVGTAEQLAKLHEALMRGPWGASVGEVNEQDAAIDENFSNAFVIVY